MNHQNIVNFRFILLLSLALVLQGCDGGTVELQTPDEPTKIVVQLLPYMSYAPFYIAEEEGYFADQGLEVEFQELRGVESLVALIQGDIDVAAGILSISLLNFIGQDEKIKIVADKGFVAPSGCTVNGLIARKDLVEAGELDTVEQLAGRTIVADPVSVEGYYLDKLLSSAGLTFDDVVLTDLPSPPSEIEAFATGAIDLSATSEPWVTRVNVEGSSVTWRNFNELIPDFQFAIITFGPNLLEKDPKVGQRFMTAYLKAVYQYNEGKTARNMELLIAFTGLEQELLEEICWPTFRDNGSINAQSIVDFQTWAAGQDLLENIVPKEAFWDSSYIESANETLAE